MLMDPKLTGFLRRALNHEMFAVQVYLTQSSLCELWGQQQASDLFSKESEDELGHAKRLIKHMLTLGLLPNGTQLPPISVTHNLHEMLLFDRHLEEEAIFLYSDACRYCARIGDQLSFDLFEGLLLEEKNHLIWIENWLITLKAND